MKIWSRYFYKEILKTFCLFIICFYGLYVLIDYASNASHIKLRGWELAGYYLFDFSSKAEVLVPFALLIATIKTLCRLNQSHELVALLASGIKLQTLLTPFLLTGLFFTGLMYLNNEVVLPRSMKELKHLEDIQKLHSKKKTHQTGIQHLMLEDQTTLLYQHFDQLEQRFYDVYWIKSINDIYRIKYLYPTQPSPKGVFIDHFTRDRIGNLVLEKTTPEQIIPAIRFNTQILKENISQADELSITTLWEALPQQTIESEKEARLVASFYYKILLPWLCLLAVLGPAPFCVQFTRTLPVFLIYALSIFGLVAMYLVFDAALILGERHVLSPLLALGTPFLFFSFFIGMKYARLS